MPGKSKAADTAAMVSEDAIRQRAYYLWEAAGRPDGTGDHYWNLAHAEATKLLVGLKRNGAAKPTKTPAKGKTAAVAVKAAKPTKAKGTKPAKAKVVKAAAPKPAKKTTPKPRAAVPAKKAK